MKRQKNIVNLSNVSINEIIKELTEFCKENKLDKKSILRATLSIEDILIKLRDKYGENKEIVYCIGKSLSSSYVMFEYGGECFDPTATEDLEFDISSTIFSGSNMNPKYLYKNGKNTITIGFEKRSLNPVVGLIGALILAIVVGTIGLFTISPEALTFINANVLSVIGSIIFGFITTISALLIFLSVITGVIGIGDVSTFGKLGKKMISKTAIFCIISMIVTAIIMITLNLSSIKYAGAQIGEEGLKVSDMITGLFPTNFFGAFVENNSMQVIVCAIAIGIAVLILGSRVNVVKSFFEETNSIICVVISWIVKLIPIYIFVTVIDIIWSGEIEKFLEAWKAIVIVIVLIVAMTIFFVIRLSIKKKVSPVLLFKKMSKGFMLALTTASSAAAFTTVIDSLENDMGVSQKISKVSLPFLNMLMVPTSVAYMLVIVMFSAFSEGINISVTWIVVACFMSLLLAVTSPPVPGGTLTCYTLLFAQLGISSQSLAIALALDLLFDFLSTGFGTIIRMCEITVMADEVGMLDEEKLKSDKY